MHCTPAVSVVKNYGVSEPTIYAYRKCFRLLEAMDVRRLETVEQGNARLMKALPVRDLQIEVMKEITRKI